MNGGQCLERMLFCMWRLIPCYWNDVFILCQTEKLDGEKVSTEVVHAQKVHSLGNIAINKIYEVSK